MFCPSKTVLSLLSLLALGACTTPGEPAQPATQPEAIQPEPTPAPVVTEVETAEPEDAIPETPKVLSTDIIGLEPVEVQNLLGPVSLKRWEGDAQVMQFTNEHCVIDIYFYETAPGEAFEATYLNARSSTGSEVGSDICLASLLPGGVWAGDQAEASPVG